MDGFAHLRTRWAAVGAAVAITLGAGGIGISHATTSSGDRAIYVAIEPCRLADTRPAPNTVGPRTAPLGAAETYSLSGWGTVGDCKLPTGTAALSLNVTAVGASQPTFLQFFPAGTTRPASGSNLNPVPGQPPTPNAVNVSLSGSGQFSVYNLQGSVNVIIDVVGVYDHHTHDDRYYTKSQTKAQIDDAAPIADWVVVSTEVPVTDTAAEIVRRTISSPAPARLLLNGAVEARESGLTGDDSRVWCWFEVMPAGGAFAIWGTIQRMELEGNSAHDEYQSMALVAGGEIPKGTSTYRVRCDADLFGGSPHVTVSATSLVVR